MAIEDWSGPEGVILASYNFNQLSQLNMARATRSASTTTPKSAVKQESTPKPQAPPKKAIPKSSAKPKPAPKSKAQAQSNLRAKPSLSTEPPSPTQSSSDDGDDSEDAYGEESTGETEQEDDDDESAFSAEEEESEAEAAVDSDNLDADTDEDETPKKGKRKSTAGAKGSDNKKVKYDPDGKNTREVEQLEKVPGPTTDGQYHLHPRRAARVYADSASDNLLAAETHVILPSTLDFLRQLMQPGHNDRDWFQQHGQFAQSRLCLR